MKRNETIVTTSTAWSIFESVTIPDVLLATGPHRVRVTFTMTDPCDQTCN